MKVWIVEGEHHYVPGIVVKVCASKTLADLEALDLVKIILNDIVDDEEEINLTVDNREAELERVKVAYADHFNSMPRVEISEHEVVGS